MLIPSTSAALPVSFFFLFFFSFSFYASPFSLSFPCFPFAPLPLYPLHLHLPWALASRPKLELAASLFASPSSAFTAAAVLHLNWPRKNTKLRQASAKNPRVAGELKERAKLASSCLVVWFIQFIRFIE